MHAIIIVSRAILLYRMQFLLCRTQEWPQSTAQRRATQVQVDAHEY